MIRIGLADDQLIFLDGLRRILTAERDLEVVGEAVNGVQAIQLAEREQPDVLLMDVEMPALDGVEATWAIIRERKLPCKIILLTTFDHDEYVLRGLQAGAVGYLLKAGGTEELLRAVRLAAQGKSWIDPAVAGKVVAALGRVQPPDPAAAPLTQREADILRLAACGTSNREIGQRLGHTEGTIKQYMREIMQKLGAADRTHAVVIAKDRGLI